MDSSSRALFKAGFPKARERKSIACVGCSKSLHDTRGVLGARRGDIYLET